MVRAACGAEARGHVDEACASILASYAEELTESTSPKSRYCQVVIDPADATLAVSFEVRFAGEQFAEATTLGPCPENNGQPK